MYHQEEMLIIVILSMMNEKKQWDIRFFFEKSYCIFK